MDLEMINLTLLNISGMLEKINSSLSDNKSNYIAFLSCIIALISVLYTWKSQKDNFFKNTFDTLISQFRTELSQINKDELRNDLFRFLKEIYQPGTINFNRTDLINDSKYVNCFVLVYRILKVIDKESISNKGYYIGIIRAIIPNDMLWLLALNSLQTNKDSDEFIFGRYKKLLEKYNIFKHIKIISPYDIDFEVSETRYVSKKFIYTCYHIDPFGHILSNFRRSSKK